MRAVVSVGSVTRCHESWIVGKDRPAPSRPKNHDLPVVSAQPHRGGSASPSNRPGFAWHGRRNRFGRHNRYLVNASSVWRVSRDVPAGRRTFRHFCLCRRVPSGGPSVRTPFHPLYGPLPHPPSLTAGDDSSADRLVRDPSNCLRRPVPEMVISRSQHWRSNTIVRWHPPPHPPGLVSATPAQLSRSPDQHPAEREFSRGGQGVAGRGRAKPRGPAPATAHHGATSPACKSAPTLAAAGQSPRATCPGFEGLGSRSGAASFESQLFEVEEVLLSSRDEMELWWKIARPVQ